jgi:hypothetical protein
LLPAAETAGFVVVELHLQVWSTDAKTADEREVGEQGEC